MLTIGGLFKDQRSADRVRKDIYSLGAKIDVNVKPVFTSRKLSQTLSVKENKPPIVNTQCVNTQIIFEISPVKCNLDNRKGNIV